MSPFCIGGRRHQRRKGTFVCQSPSGRWSVTQATIDPKKSARLKTRPESEFRRSSVFSSR